MRAQARKAWPNVYFRLLRAPERRRRQRQRGVIGSIMLLLWRTGWDSRGLGAWLDRDGRARKLPGDQEDGDPAAIIEARMQDAQLQLREQAVLPHDGQGAEQGIDAFDLVKHLETLRKRGMHLAHGALLTAACAGTWTKERKCQAFGGDDLLCERGQQEDDSHRFRGHCSASQERDIRAKTAGLERRAKRGAESCPAFWLRGLTPRTRAAPPPCDAQGQEALAGERLQTRRLRGRGGEALVASGDGSGGGHSNDERNRRCGLGWTALDTEGRAGNSPVRAAKFGPLPGARQTHNRAELRAFIGCAGPTEGPLVFWADSEVT